MRRNNGAAALIVAAVILYCVQATVRSCANEALSQSAPQFSSLSPGPGLFGDSHWRAPVLTLPSTGNRQGDVRLSAAQLWYWNGIAWIQFGGSPGGGGGAPSGPAGGELGGDYPNPVIVLTAGQSIPDICSTGRVYVDQTPGAERFCVCAVASPVEWRCSALAQQAFEPSQVSGMTLWLRGDSLATLGLDNRAQVGHWPDSSGRGNGANQIALSFAPLFSPAALGPLGRPSVLFDGVLSWMQLPPIQSLITPAGDGTVFIVYELDAIQTSFGAGVVFQDEALLSEPSGSWGLHLANLAQPTAFAYSFNGSEGVVSVGLPVALGQWQLAAMRHGGGQLCLSIDGAAESCVANGATDLSANRQAELGQGGGPRRITGAIGAALVFSRVLSGPERVKVVAYLKRRFGIS